MTSTSTKQQGRKLPTLLLLNPLAYAWHNPAFSNIQKAESHHNFVDESLKDKALLKVQLSVHIDSHSFHLFSHRQSALLLINDQWLTG